MIGEELHPVGVERDFGDSGEILGVRGQNDLGAFGDQVAIGRIHNFHHRRGGVAQLADPHGCRTGRMPRRVVGDSVQVEQVSLGTDRRAEPPAEHCFDVVEAKVAAVVERGVDQAPVRVELHLGDGDVVGGVRLEHDDVAVEDQRPREGQIQFHRRRLVVDHLDRVLHAGRLACGVLRHRLELHLLPDLSCRHLERLGEGKHRVRGDELVVDIELQADHIDIVVGDGLHQHHAAVDDLGSLRGQERTDHRSQILLGLDRHRCRHRLVAGRIHRDCLEPDHPVLGQGSVRRGLRNLVEKLVRRREIDVEGRFRAGQPKYNRRDRHVVASLRPYRDHPAGDDPG